MNKRLAKVRTFQEYISLPLSIREKRVWWCPFKIYQEPIALEMDLHSLPGLDQWGLFEAYTREHYPIQRFFRDDVVSTWRGWCNSVRSLKYTIKNYLINPRKEMRKKVFPPRYQDLDTIITEFHLQCIIEFVDREDCFNHTVYTSCEADIIFAKELREHYDYAKTGRKKLVEDIKQAWDRVPPGWKIPTDQSPDVTYQETNTLEAQLVERDTKLCEWVIKYRAHLWT